MSGTWQLSAAQLDAIEQRLRRGQARPDDVMRLLVRVRQLEAVADGLRSERDAAESAAVANGRVLQAMREVRDGGAPEPTKLAGLLYWLGEADHGGA
ncbi:hypothetical protein SEA_SCHMIDT_44 [Gordonia phage Schmidt]|uniref:Uncharacterized protein n=1 Tax=Gordonia phage Schmidt TaxID=2301697 RepID=A0A385E098_9CAUD|nr:hypothetical protein KDJ59_gp44 [Gordonia phage Schmidt]AXQ65166.1 hypothetical protein SEA_SCHMIDT_44 [Gordonia phage Schmidt]